MRGLAFPTNVLNDREASVEYATPLDADVPIDPALGGMAIDPTMMREVNGVHQEQNPAPYAHEYEPHPIQQMHEPRQYSQGPQGDPFAPQPPPMFMPMEEETPPPLVKRKRKPRREKNCGFCGGDDTKNKVEEVEQMITCSACGRSAHPTCMEITQVVDVARTYLWNCIECTKCEICGKKGNDARLMFCDSCDRGWHLDCLDPPIAEAPDEDWYCPMCPLDDPFTVPPEEEMLNDSHKLSYPPPEVSTVSSPLSSSPVKSRQKGKAKAAIADDSEAEIDTPLTHKVRGRPRSMKKARARAMEPGLTTDDVPGASSPRLPKRLRIRSPAPPLPRIRLRLGKARDHDDDEPNKGLFDDLLRPQERDCTKTTVESGDKVRFERSRSMAENKLVPPPPPTTTAPDVYTPLGVGPSNRPLRSSTLQHLQLPNSTPGPGVSASPPPSTPGPSSKAPVGAHPVTLRIRTIRFGPYDIQTWYDAPFPEEYANILDGRLWICEFCLKYMKSRFGAGRHRMKCKARHPPGDEIYRDGAVSIFEVDGRKNKIYCQNLCLLSKMFLDHKSLFYDVEPFLFYVMSEVDDIGARFVGYFSKEKRSPKDYNVSCIMTLPVRQRQGWGNLLIDFSYLLSKKEQRLGSPEKPLSGLGALGYKNYWTLAVMRYLESAPEHVRLEDICSATAMTVEDVFVTLSQQNMIFVREITPPSVRPSPGQSIKLNRGRKHTGFARRHLQRAKTKDEEAPQAPFAPPKHYDIRWDPEKVEKYLANWESKGYLRLKPEKLKWSPFLLTRAQKNETLPALATTLATTPATQSEDVFDGPRTGGSSTSGRSQPTMVDLGLFDDNHVSLAVVHVDRPDAASPVVENVSSSRESSALPSKRMRSRSTRSKSAAIEVQQTGQRHTQRGSRQANGAAGISEGVVHSTVDNPVPLKRSISGNPGSRNLSPRKRLRVESSPEIEIPAPVPSPAHIAPPMVDTSFANDHTSVPPTDNSVSPPRHKRKPSLLTNGYDILLHTRPQTTDITTQEDADPSESTTPNILLTALDTHNIEHVPNQLDVKSEDPETPLTSLTSRQSMPSDDTVFAEDPHQHAANGHRSKEQQRQQPTDSSDVTGTIAMVGKGLVDEDADADADGEFEEDAEGEPDDGVLDL